MQTITRDFKDWTRDRVLTVVPVGDVHIGAGGCDEDRLVRVVDYIRQTPDCYWLGMGDYCDFINKSDPRFSPATLARWFKVSDLADIARAERDRFLSIVKPITKQCLALAEGNHETAIARHYERSIYSEIVTGVREAAGWPDTHRLELGYVGWLRLVFYRSEEGERRQRAETVRVKVHHGHGGGRLAGSKALNMERQLWTHDCDIYLMGHTHIAGYQQAAVETLDNGGHIHHAVRYGVHTGTFLRSTNPGGAPTYAEIAGYMPLPLGNVALRLKPHAADRHQRIRVESLDI